MALKNIMVLHNNNNNVRKTLRAAEKEKFFAK